VTPLFSTRPAPSRLVLFAAPLAFLACTAHAQQAYTAADYARAEKMMGYSVNPLVDHTIAAPDYLPDGRVFFRDPSSAETVYKIASPNGTVTPAFDSAKLAAALTAAGVSIRNTHRLQVTDYMPKSDGGFSIVVSSRKVNCDAAVTACTPDTATQNTAPAGRASRGLYDISPDKTKGAFIRDWNLWVRDMKTGHETQLTHDGVENYGYATDDAGWSHSDRAVVLWSPDSQKIATFQQDMRKTGDMYLVPVTYRHPVLDHWKGPMLGDKDVTMIERVVIDLPTGTMTRLKMPPDQHRSTICDDVSCRGGSGWDDVQFSADGKHLAFVSSSRDHKDAWLKVADTTTGEIRDVYHEHVDSYFESGTDRVNWKYLPASNEFLWFSERTNFGQMYLYDLNTGQLKNQITHGDGPVTQVLYVDEKARIVYFLATGKESGNDPDHTPTHDPYFTNYYRASFDGKDQRPLTPEDADHAITPSLDGKTFVDIYSTPTTPKTAVLRSTSDGKVLATLGKQDISRLSASGWQPLTPIKVKARDGVTELFGYMWKPTNFDASKKYPVVDYVYPGPQTGSCGSRQFAAAHGDDQALAELGFVVVCIDGMGTPWRSKKFHDFYSHAETMGDNTIPDQIAGLKDLAKQYPFLDLDRVGIWGHSGGGNATTTAMFGFPDFFKVGIAESGNHDNRDYEDDWDEKWGGLETNNDTPQDNYNKQAAENYASNLKGHILLAHGTMDDNVPPSNTLLVVDALIKANKDFDLILIPNAHHGYGEASQYMMRRRWDYFVRNLAGATPPLNYQMRNPADIARIAAEGPSASGPSAGDFAADATSVENPGDDPGQ
jgi:dipeptidyl-peptidase-4